MYKFIANVMKSLSDVVADYACTVAFLARKSINNNNNNNNSSSSHLSHSSRQQQLITLRLGDEEASAFRGSIAFTCVER